MSGTGTPGVAKFAITALGFPRTKVLATFAAGIVAGVAASLRARQSNRTNPAGVGRGAAGGSFARAVGADTKLSPFADGLIIDGTLPLPNGPDNSKNDFHPDPA